MPDATMERFAHQAERLVEPPELDGLIARGRRRQALGAGLAVAGLVVAALLGGWLVRGLLAAGTVPPVGRPERVRAIEDPDQLPLNLSQDGTTGVGLTRLRAGEAYHVRPFGPDDPVLVRFAPGAGGWSWGTDGVIRPGESERVGPDHVSLAVLAPSAVRTRPCEPFIYQYWEQIAETPAAAAGQLSELPEFGLTAGPERVVAFGAPAVHIRFRIDETTCEGLRSMYLLVSEHATVAVRPPSATDVWFLETPSGLLTVVMDVGDAAPRDERRQLSALVRGARVDETG